MYSRFSKQRNRLLQRCSDNESATTHFLCMCLESACQFHYEQMTKAAVNAPEWQSNGNVKKKKRHRPWNQLITLKPHKLSILSVKLWTGVRTATKSVLGRLRELTPLLRSSLPVRTKLLVSKAYIRPQITYAAEAWAFISKSNLTRLQAIQNTVESR